MNKIVYLVLLAAGIVVLIYGINASNSTASSISNAFSGNPTNKSMWLIGSGIVGIVAGGAGLLFSRRGGSS